MELLHFLPRRCLLRAVPSSPPTSALFFVSSSAVRCLHSSSARFLRRRHVSAVRSEAPREPSSRSSASSSPIPPESSSPSFSARCNARVSDSHRTSTSPFSASSSSLASFSSSQPSPSEAACSPLSPDLASSGKDADDITKRLRQIWAGQRLHAAAPGSHALQTPRDDFPPYPPSLSSRPARLSREEDLLAFAPSSPSSRGASSFASSTSASGAFGVSADPHFSWEALTGEVWRESARGDQSRRREFPGRRVEPPKTDDLPSSGEPRRCRDPVARNEDEAAAFVVSGDTRNPRQRGVVVKIHHRRICGFIGECGDG
ncbi:zinc finger, C3HC4 type (RING finger) domain-containing protein [Besnoitia besnoiti]|uniref:Zinc finger, C3HC4 type (RING finger) domain-containing protein n=1 Tax=Besnoitia besnoiti TaxID=94643 RepID=A0A2A9MQS0_BESBE|nr:zinc finger, C3HC4 type (RING finger) domain-containing protein [Besnoitia besnoiti]PFH38432.1 zinc finger, C3HC4 type (RING finger) domain-containing protein [Besnoitia besnoiti]